MKKLWIFALMAALALSSTACGHSGLPVNTGTSRSTETETDPGNNEASRAAITTVAQQTETSKEGQKMHIQVTDETHTVIFELNNSPAAKSLYDQLPLRTDVENYSDDEKIFYPKILNTDRAINADAKKGTLAYFSPWGDVVMYYRDFGSYTGLYELGYAISGADVIQFLSGTIDITALN